MSELSPEARALLNDGQGVLRPSAADRSRIVGALALRLGPAAMLVSAPAVAVTTKSLLWQNVSLAAAGLGLVAAAASYVWLEPNMVPAPPTAASVVTPRSAASVAAPPSEPFAEPQASDTAPVAEAAPATPARAVDNLATEVRILSRAMTVLRAGNPAEALRLLETHQQQFPSGRLLEERRAARVQALCALGKRSEAEGELARLERGAPRSVHVARAKRACGLN